MVTCIGWKSDHVVRGDAEGSINVWDLKTKSTKTISACRRGTHVKKIRFAPGKGNMKLLVLGHDPVSIWDVKSGDLWSLKTLDVWKSFFYDPEREQWRKEHTER